MKWVIFTPQRQGLPNTDNKELYGSIGVSSAQTIEELNRNNLPKRRVLYLKQTIGSHIKKGIVIFLGHRTP